MMYMDVIEIYKLSLNQVKSQKCNVTKLNVVKTDVKKFVTIKEKCQNMF